MRIFGRIVSGVYILCGVVAVTGALVLWANSSLVETLTGYLKAEPHVGRIGIAALAVLVAGTVWLVFWFDHVYRSSAISFDNPGGRVKVSLRAIEEFITSRILNHVPGVKSLTVRASMSARGLETHVNLKLFAGTNIPETCAGIQEITKNYLQDVVGVERVSTIEVFVSNIVTRDVPDEAVPPEAEQHPPADEPKPES